MRRLTQVLHSSYCCYTATMSSRFARVVNTIPKLRRKNAWRPETPRGDNGALIFVISVQNLTLHFLEDC